MLNYEYPPLGGGAGPVTKELASKLAEAGHAVDVVTMGFHGLPGYEEYGKLVIQRVPSLRRSLFRAITVEMISYVVAAFIRSLVLTRRDHYDLVHAHFIIPTSLVALPLKQVRGLPYVITIHGSDIPGYNPDRFKRGHRVLAPLWWQIVQHADAIISPSRYLRDLLHQSAVVPVDIIPYGFVPSPITGKTRRKRMLAASRLFHRKGIQFFLEALGDLPLDDWEIVVAGDGPMLSELQAQARRLNLPVRFPGFVKGDELRHLYESSEIFVFPSLRDNFPVVLLEAMSAGCAVVTSDISGMPEVLGDTGLLVPPGDINALREAVRRLMDDPELRQECGQRARQRINLFSWERILNEHLLLYQRVLDDAARTNL